MALTFYNRGRELAILRRIIDAPRGQLFILYGRRGVGKSALLAHALDQRPHAYYRATRRTLPLQLQALTDVIREAFPEEFVPNQFGSTDEYLQFLTAYASRRSDEPTIAVIDELPYLADADPGFLTVLQHWWDDNKQLTNLRLFLIRPVGLFRGKHSVNHSPSEHLPQRRAGVASPAGAAQRHRLRFNLACHRCRQPPPRRHRAGNRQEFGAGCRPPA